MRVVWDDLGQVIWEILYWVLVLVIANGGIYYALIFPLGDLGMGVIPKL
jgi:hypothetical protein